MDKLFGGIEFGGTKTICAVGRENGDLVVHETIPTTSVEETLRAVCGFFARQSPVTALGVGSFGPLDINEQSLEYGSIRNSPKEGWTNVALNALLTTHFDIPIKFDLDVNCAALGELHFGAGKNVDSFVYITLGTGIGGSLIINRRLEHGIMNLEMGHMRIPYEFLDGFEGACKFHGACLEGIASGHAMEQHYGQKPEDIKSQDIWSAEANYIALALNNIIMTIGPEKIILGGGLIRHEELIEQIRSKLSFTINGYLQVPDLDDYVVKSTGDTNGVLGAIKLVASANRE